MSICTRLLLGKVFKDNHQTHFQIKMIKTNISTVKVIKRKSGIVLFDGLILMFILLMFCCARSRVKMSWVKIDIILIPSLAYHGTIVIWKCQYCDYIMPDITTLTEGKQILLSSVYQILSSPRKYISSAPKISVWGTIIHSWYVCIGVK